MVENNLDSLLYRELAVGKGFLQLTQGSKEFAPYAT
jgi:hypothetical protein